MSTQASAKSAGAKKMIKIAAASALGLALVTGGTTYALWTVTGTANTAGAVATGDLKVTAAAVQNWSDVTVPATPVEIAAIGTYKLSPGSTIKLKQDVTAIVNGANMTANLSVTVPNAATGEILAQSVAKVTVFDKNNVQVGTATAPTTGLGDLNLLIPTPKTDVNGDVYHVEVTVSLPTSADDTTQLQNIALSNMQINLSQVPTP